MTMRPPVAGEDRVEVLERYGRVRALTVELCAPLAIEDYGVQRRPEASPPKWHLAHTTWFFETLVLAPHLPGYELFHPGYGLLFNSYYHAFDPQGRRVPQADRGRYSRPRVAEIFRYRRTVDEAVQRLLWGASNAEYALVAPLLELGLHHEQQHQELLITDIKAALHQPPLYPAYVEPKTLPPAAPRRGGCTAFEGGLVEVGHEAQGFAFDHERPRHRVYLRPFALANDLVTVGEYRAFMDDGGYRRPELWPSDGWAAVQARCWQAPLYWIDLAEGPREYTLYGPRPLDDHAPVTHVSFYEAQAFAAWAGKRLPTEQEWEHAAQVSEAQHRPGLLLNDRVYQPRGRGEGAPANMVGEAWEWTQSAYGPYPGYQPPEGALGEYNGKFMANQWVLRGGSVATPRDHMRLSYRNFFYPHQRWQFTGIRLAQEV